MATVKDTESFIAAARAVHGNRYDYSQTVYRGSREKLRIACPEHGEFWQWPSDHFRPKRVGDGHMGCRKCGDATRTTNHKNRRYKICQCGFRGYGAKQFPRQAGGMCATCWAKKMDRGPLKRCLHCDQEIPGSYQRNPNSKRYCSGACRSERQAERKVDVPCCVCGKAVQRYRSHLERFSSACCSRQCQQIDRNRKTPVVAMAAVNRSSRARRRWKRMHRRRRMEKYAICQAKLRRIVGERRAFEQLASDEGMWLYRITLRIGEHKHRKKRGVFTVSPPGSIAGALKRLSDKRKRAGIDPWKVKITQKLSGIRKRRRSKDESKSNRSRDLPQTSGEPVQMRFDWVGH